MHTRQEHEQQLAKSGQHLKPPQDQRDLELTPWEAQKHNVTAVTPGVTSATGVTSAHGSANGLDRLELGGPSSSGGSALAPMPLLGGRAKGKRRGWGRQKALRSDQYDVWGMGGVGEWPWSCVLCLCDMCVQGRLFVAVVTWQLLLWISSWCLHGMAVC